MEKSFGRTELVQHWINTRGTNNIKQLARALPPFVKHEETAHIIKEMLKNDVIEESNSPWSRAAY